jgi:predicted permease
MADIDAEVQSHLDARVEYLIERGLSPEQARAEALRRFGNLAAGRAAIFHEAQLAGPRLHLGDRMHDLLQDIRYVARGLGRAPAFTIGVVATLALGLGINAAVFRVADFVLFRAPAGVTKPSEIRRVMLSLALGRGTPTKAPTFSYPDAAKIAQVNAFAATSLYVVQAGHDQEARDVTVNYVDVNYLGLLGEHPMAGRAFSAEEAVPGARIPAAIVSRDYWQSALGSVPLGDALRITINGNSYPVVGIMPRGFRGLELDPTDIWLPLGAGDFGHGEINGVVIPWYQTGMLRSVRVIGRQTTKVSDDVVAARLDAALSSAGDGATRRTSLEPIVPIGGGARSQETNALLGRLTIVAAIILLIACANAVNLVLARGLRRHQEVAIRMAIGASRARVSRLLIIESLMLAMLGGAAAIIAGFWTAESLRRLLFPDGKWTASAFDGRTLIFTGVLALGVAALAAFAPTLQATTPDLVSGLKHQRARGGGHTRSTRAALIVVQTALSLAMLIASGLLVRSLIRLNAVPMGFDADGLVTVTLNTPRFGKPLPGETQGAELAERLASTGKTQAVAIASNVPFGAMAVMTTKVIGATGEPGDNTADPRWSAVSANYFSVMRTRALWGRTFNAGDTTGSEPVVIINQSMARTYFGGTPPSNACVLPVGAPCLHIVGIVEDVRDTPNGAAPPMRYYMPLTQYETPANGVIIRTDPASSKDVAALVKGMLPPSPRGAIQVISDLVDIAMRPWLSATWLFATFGGLALALACVGMYSVMTYVASERMHELGMRVVLGATGGDIIRLVTGNGMRMTLTGCALGLVGAALGTRYLGTLLFSVSPFDPVTYSLALAALVAASLLAVLPPALRASRVDPVAAFRVD